MVESSEPDRRQAPTPNPLLSATTSSDQEALTGFLHHSVLHHNDRAVNRLRH